MTGRLPLAVLVAGASSGIGAALVRALAADGHRLFACARREALLRDVTEDDRLARSRRCDVAEEADVVALFRWLAGETERLDALVLCAGAQGAIGHFADTDTAAWWATVRTNVLSVYLMAKHALPLLGRSPCPRILTFAGGGAFGTFPRYSAYAASKAAVVRLTECLAEELGPARIAVNAVAPGMVATPIHAATMEAGPERAGREYWERTRHVLAEGGIPIDVPVDCVRFLLSPAADGMTGKTISASFDPWRSDVFRDHLAEIARSDLYTLRRMNLANLPDGSLRETLS